MEETILGQLLHSFAAGLNVISLSIFGALLLLLYPLAQLLKRAKDVAREVRAATSKIKELSPAGGLLEHQVPDLETALPTLPIFQEQWHEFREGFVAIDGTVHNTLSSDEFIKDEMFLQSVSWKGLHFPLVSSLPGVATGLGLLGTFLGIVVGLGKLSTHQQHILEHIGPVIGALSSAFWTSIVGVLIATFTTIVGHLFEGRLLSALHDFREALDRRVPRLTEQGLLYNVQKKLDTLSDIRKESEEGRSYLQTMANDLASRLGDRFDNSLANHLAPTLTQISSALQGHLEQATATSSEQARRFTDEMVQQLTTSMQEGLTTMGAQFSEAGEQIHSLTENLRKVVDNASQAVELQRRTLKEGSQAVEAASQRSVAATEQLTLVERVATDLTRLSEDLAERQDTLLGLQEHQNSLATSSEESTLRIVSALDDVQDSYSHTADQLRSALTSAGETLGRLSSNLGSFEERTALATEQLDRAITGLNSRLELEQQSIAQFGSLTSEMNSLIQTAAPVGRQLSEATRSLQEALDSARLERDNLARQREAVIEMEESARESLRTLEGALRSAAGSMDSSSTAISNTLRSIEGWANQATNTIENFGTGLQRSIQSSLTAYDESLATAVRSLKTAMEDLEDIASQIEENTTPNQQQVTQV